MDTFTGKIVGGFQYAHRDALHLLNPIKQKYVLEASKNIPDQIPWNVTKIDIKKPENLSLLEYSDFRTDPFPSLLKSHKIDLNDNSVASRNHSISNPPILHRKELLLPITDQEYEKFAAVTKVLEHLGAFSEMHKYGTKVPWERKLSDLKIEILEHSVFVDNVQVY